MACSAAGYCRGVTVEGLPEMRGSAADRHEGVGFGRPRAAGGREALEAAEEKRPDVVLLDIVLPDMTGIEVMRRLREETDAAIILVTAKDSDADKVRGLEMGADDYIVKPFSPEEMGARIRGVLRRTQGDRGAGRQIRIGGLEIDLNRRVVSREGKVIPLTRTEWLGPRYPAGKPGG